MSFAACADVRGLRDTQDSTQAHRLAASDSSRITKTLQTALGQKNDAVDLLREEKAGFLFQRTFFSHATSIQTRWQAKLKEVAEKFKEEMEKTTDTCDKHMKLSSAMGADITRKEDRTFCDLRRKTNNDKM